MALGDRVSKYNKIFLKKCNNKQQIGYQVSVTKFKRYIREFVYDLKEVKNGKKKKTGNMRQLLTVRKTENCTRKKIKF